MNKGRTPKLYCVGTVLVLTMFAAGCATKKYVRNTLDPLEARLGKAEEQGSENSRRITEVDQNAQQGIGEAKSQAGAAGEQATQADKRAQGAETLAQKGLTETERIRQELRNADNFQPLRTGTVQFGFDRTDLSEESIHTLDELASLAKSTKRYVIEVQGFADQVGSETYNLELSRRRADAVVRYLTMVHKIPMARVFDVGYGEAEPVASNDSREGREQNRRVEIRVLAVREMSGESQQAQMPSSTTGQQ